MGNAVVLCQKENVKKIFAMLLFARRYIPRGISKIEINLMLSTNISCLRHFQS
jgi:hypothetical protein